MAENEMNKRRRGRPKGASRLNPADHLTLMTMADLILSKTMLPTTAMRRLGILGEADTRRLQRKWKASGAHYLEGARNPSVCRAHLGKRQIRMRSTSSRLTSSFRRS